ncbi:MAG: FHA domain-containing protein [Thermoanaerobaculia bacterium]
MARSDRERHVKPMLFPSEIARRGRAGQAPAPPQKGVAAEGEPARLTLRLTNTSLPGSPVEVHAFLKTTVTVGRSRDCDLTVDDQKHVVSGKHVRFSVEDGKLLVADLGSRNFTYLDGEQLEPDVPREIAPGSTVSIAEFAIQVESDEAEASIAEPATVFEESYQNPFREEAVRLAEVLARIGEVYEAEAPGRRDGALREAVEEVLTDAPDGSIRQTLARSLHKAEESGS